MNSEPRDLGRPPKDENRTRYHESELHTFLAENLPSEYVRDKRVNALALANAMGYARYHIYRHLSDNRLSPKLAVELISISEKTEEKQKKGLLTLELLARFVIKR